MLVGPLYGITNLSSIFLELLFNKEKLKELVYSTESMIIEEILEESTINPSIIIVPEALIREKFISKTTVNISPETVHVL